MRWGDFLVIAATVLICGLLWGKLALGFLEKGTQAWIVINNETVLRYDLLTQKKLYESNQILSFAQSYTEEKNQDGNTVIHLSSQGIHYDLLLENGRIRFSKNTCPDQVCIQTGFISKPGQVAACIPAQTLVRISGNAANQDIDVIIK